MVWENPFEALSYVFDRNDCIVIISCCCLIGLIYRILENYVQTEKGRAWIVMLTSSAVLSLFGSFYVIRAHCYGLWTVDHIYAEDFISRCVLLFFFSSNIMDLALGVYGYPKFLDPFSTIAHHVFYIAFISILLNHHYSRGFILCFFMEIPTFVLSIGTIWPSLRSDLLFGVTFITTRLIYNFILAITLYFISPEGNIWKVCCGVLGLHVYWFSKWCKKQGIELLRCYLGISLLTSSSKELHAEEVTTSSGNTA